MVTKLFSNDIDKEGKHGSLTNIISVWNSMVGSGLLTIPWAYSQSGLMLGVILSFTSFCVSFTTQYFVFIAAGDDLDYTDTLMKYFGRRGWKFGMYVFIGFLFIPIMVFMQLLSQILFTVLLGAKYAVTGAG